MSTNKNNSPPSSLEEKLLHWANPNTWFGWFGRRKITPPGDIRYAGFHDRVFAAGIDIILLTLLLFRPFFWIASMLLGEERAIPFYMMHMQTSPATVQAMINSPGYWTDWTINSLMQMVIIGIIFILSWHYSSMTPGKWLLRMRIVDADTGTRPSDRQFILRFIGSILASLPLFLGFIGIIFDKKKRGWHDKMADTVVIKVRHWRITPPEVSEYPPEIADNIENTTEEE